MGFGVHPLGHREAMKDSILKVYASVSLVFCFGGLLELLGSRRYLFFVLAFSVAYFESAGNGVCCWLGNATSRYVKSTRRTIIATPLPTQATSWTPTALHCEACEISLLKFVSTLKP